MNSSNVDNHLPSFSIGDYVVGAVYLHWGNVNVKVANRVDDFDKFADRIGTIHQEIKENCLPRKNSDEHSGDEKKLSLTPNEHLLIGELEKLLAHHDAACSGYAEDHCDDAESARAAIRKVRGG